MIVNKKTLHKNNNIEYISRIKFEMFNKKYKELFMLTDTSHVDRKSVV